MATPTPEQVRQDLIRFQEIIIGLTEHDLPPNTLSELIRIRRSFKRLAKSAGVDVDRLHPDTCRREWKRLADAGDYMGAIREYQQLTGSPIFAAKEAVEGYVGKPL